MISWIVASHDPLILFKNLAASMTDPGDDQVVVVEDAPSIAAAYNEGQRQAVHPIRCYIHHDVQVLDVPRLRTALVNACRSDVGMVGLIGSRTRVMPWWDGAQLGSVMDQRVGVLNAGPGGECVYLDGVLLATAHHVSWDESIPGWHGYDYDACEQMRARGLPNVCLTGGHEVLRHNTAGPGDPDLIDGFHDAMARLRQKWGS